MYMRFLVTTMAFFFSVGMLYSMDKRQAPAPQEIAMRTVKLNSQAHVERALSKIYSSGYTEDEDCFDYSSSSSDDESYTPPTTTHTQTQSASKPSLNINS
jgi:hypothetical protein